jgi:hypothetical protein
MQKIMDNIHNNALTMVYGTTTAVNLDMVPIGKYLLTDDDVNHRLYMRSGKNNLVYFDMFQSSATMSTTTYGTSSSIYWTTVMTSKIIDKDRDTWVDTEQNADEDKVRTTTGGTERVVIDANGVQLATELPVVFDGTGGDTKWKYNASTTYLEAWVDGLLRMEM